MAPTGTLIDGTVVTLSLPVVDLGISQAVDVSDFVANSFARVQGVATNFDGSLSGIRADSTYLLNPGLRLQGILGTTSSNAGLDFHPLNNGPNSFPLSTRLTFAASAEPEIEIFDSYCYKRVSSVPIRDPIIGPIKAALRPNTGQLVLVGATKGGTLFDMPPSFFSLATTIVLGLPLSVWLAAVAFAIAAFMLRYHRLGRALYAIGGNPEAARAAGIRVERITWGVFVLGSMLAAVGGLIVTGYVGAINANQGNGMIFTVFAAAVIGGISLDGGKGSMLGALSGVLLLGVVQNLLTLAQVPSFWIQAIYGAIILGSLMVARLASGEGQN